MKKVVSICIFCIGGMVTPLKTLVLCFGISGQKGLVANLIRATWRMSSFCIIATMPPSELNTSDLMNAQHSSMALAHNSESDIVHPLICHCTGIYLACPMIRWGILLARPQKVVPSMQQLHQVVLQHDELSPSEQLVDYATSTSNMCRMVLPEQATCLHFIFLGQLIKRLWHESCWPSPGQQ